MFGVFSMMKRPDWQHNLPPLDTVVFSYNGMLYRPPVGKNAMSFDDCLNILLPSTGVAVCQPFTESPGLSVIVSPAHRTSSTDPTFPGCHDYCWEAGTKQEKCGGGSLQGPQEMPTRTAAQKSIPLLSSFLSFFLFFFSFLFSILNCGSMLAWVVLNAHKKWLAWKLASKDFCVL